MVNLLGIHIFSTDMMLPYCTLPYRRRDVLVFMSTHIGASKIINSVTVFTFIIFRINPFVVKF